MAARKGVRRKQQQHSVRSRDQRPAQPSVQARRPSASCAEMAPTQASVSGEGGANVSVASLRRPSGRSSCRALAKSVLKRLKRRATPSGLRSRKPIAKRRGGVCEDRTLDVSTALREAVLTAMVAGGTSRSRRESTQQGPAEALAEAGEVWAPQSTALVTRASSVTVLQGDQPGQRARRARRASVLPRGMKFKSIATKQAMKRIAEAAIMAAELPIEVVVACLGGAASAGQVETEEEQREICAAVLWEKAGRDGGALYAPRKAIETLKVRNAGGVAPCRTRRMFSELQCM